MNEELLGSYQNVALDIARDPRQFSNYFFGKYAHVRGHLFGSLVVGKDNIYSQVQEPTRREVLNKIQALFKDFGNGPDGGVLLQLGIYRPFAESQGFTENTEYGEAIILPTRLNENQKVHWLRYINSLEVIQAWRELTATTLRNVPFPSVSIKYQPKNIPLAVELETVKRQIVSMLLPHISDEEAKVALGEWYARQDVMSPASPDWFTG